MNALALLSVVALLLTAKTVELYHDQHFQPQWNRDTLVHGVLHEPWWQAA